MSHRHTVIEPASGLTVLVGENNCGKSAVVAALQILCNNAGGDYMVRHGQKECRIVVETDEGHLVEWSRRDGTVSYVLDGQPIHRLRGGTPDELHKLLRMPQVYSQGSGESFDVHFGEQKKPIFLLDASGGQAAKFFASSSDAEALIKMQILHRDNIREASKRSTRLQERQKVTESRLQPLDAIEHIQKRLDELDERYDGLEVLGTRIGNLEQMIHGLEQLVGEADLLQAKETIIASLKTPPGMRDATSLAELAVSLDHWLLRSRHFESQRKTLQGLQDPPRLRDTLTLEVLTLDMAQVSIEVRRNAKIALTLSGLGGVPRLTPTQGLEAICQSIRNIADEAHHRQGLVNCLIRLAFPPELFDPGFLIDDIHDLERTQKDERRCREKIAALEKCEVPPEMGNEALLADLIDKLEDSEKEVMGLVSICKTFELLVRPPTQMNTRSLAMLIAEDVMVQHSAGAIQYQFDQITLATIEAEKAIRSWVEDFPICPTCGAELDPDRLISMTNSAIGGHVHV